MRRLREWLEHRKQLLAHYYLLRERPAPEGTKRRIFCERMPNGSHSLTQQFKRGSEIVRQDMTIIFSRRSMRAATIEAGEV